MVAKIQIDEQIRQFPQKLPIDPNCYYTIADISDRKSPRYIASAATIFRAFRGGTLVPSKIGRKTLLRGEAIHKWLEGGDEE